jgi:hypothetical protein
MNNQVCAKVNTECQCNKWHYTLKNGIQVLSKKYPKCHPRTQHKQKCGDPQ